MNNPITSFNNTGMRTDTAFGHIKSRYWNKLAAKSVQASIRKHYKQNRMANMFLVQAM